MAPRLRIFLSSPGDVNSERLRAHLVIQKLARDYQRYFAIEPFLWEYEPMLASQHFQDAIDPPSSFDIVLMFLWSRLGTPLPEKTEVREYRGIDGRAPVTGTEWEFEDALKANRAHGGKGPPDLLVYRRMGGATTSLENPAKRDEEIKQYEALEVFWRRWFKSDTQFLAGYAEYHALDEFDRRLEGDLSNLIQRHIKERHIDQAAPIWLKGSPFRGLQAYDFADAPVFFGRDGETREGLARLAEAAGRGTAFLMVAGPSGSGKSSLARAGVLPSLVATKAVADVGLWRRVVMRPGDAGADPILAFARALLAGDPAKGEGLAELAGKQMTAEELAVHLAAGGDPVFLFKRTLRDLADAERGKLGLLPHEQARLVLLVDQLEEILTRPEIRAERRKRFACILAALAGSGVVWVIATLRSDLWHRVDEVAELRDLAERGARLALAAPDAAQLLEIIRQPAQAAGLAFGTDPGRGVALDAMLAREAAAEPGVLPLLSVILDDLYACDVEKGDGGGVLTVASYRALGGLRAAIGQRAERKLQSLQEADAAAANALPTVLRALVTLGASGDAPTARQLPLATFAASSPERRLVEVLVAADARLLTVEDRGKGPEVRLAHEALIENWPRAKTILGESGNFIRIRDDIEAQRRKWESAHRRAEFLLARGLPLAEGEDIVDKFGPEISPEIGAFVKASRRHARRHQQLVGVMFLSIILIITVVLVAGYGTFSNDQMGKAFAARTVADKAMSGNQYEKAMRFALYGVSPLPAVMRKFASTLGLRTTALPINPFAIEWSALETRRIEAKLAGAAQSSMVLAELVGHRQPVRAAAFSFDGARVLTASDDGTARAWDANRGTLILQLHHEGALRSAEFGRHGTRILTASADGTVSVWDSSSEKLPIRTFKVPGGLLWSAAFSPDGGRIVTASADGFARVWNTEADEAPLLLDGHADKPMLGAAFSPDGTRIATALNRTARVFDAHSGSGLLELAGHHKNVIRGIAYSPDGNRIVTASFDNTAQVWDANNGRWLLGLNHDDWVFSGAFSGDGTRIVTSSKDGTARVWDAVTGAALFDLSGHNDEVVSAAFSPDGTRIVTASEDKTARIWDANGTLELLRIEIKGTHILSAAFNFDHTLMVTASEDQTARVWDVTKVGRQIGAPLMHDGVVRSAAFSPDGTRILTASDDGFARLWDAKTGALRQSFHHVWPDGAVHDRDPAVKCAAFSPDGRQIVTASDDGYARLWDVDSGKAWRMFHHVWANRGSNAGDPAVHSAAFSPDGRRIVTASEDNEARVWNVEGPANPLELKGHDGDVWTAQFSPDGTRIVTASWDHTARVWDAKTGAELVEFRKHKGLVFSAAFGPGGARIVSGSGDRTARVWDADTGEEILAYHGHLATIRSAAFSNDGTRVVTASEDGTARVWNAEWLVNPRREELAQRVCSKKLIGDGRFFTREDSFADPALSDLAGKDACSPYQ